MPSRSFNLWNTERRSALDQIAAAHAAIGGDTDGQGGREAAPLEIDSVADYLKLADVLGRRGYSTENVEKVMYRNWQRFFEKALPITDPAEIL